MIGSIATTNALGLVRTENQDRLFSNNVNLFVVADGMGAIARARMPLRKLSRPLKGSPAACLKRPSLATAAGSFRSLRGDIECPQ